MDPQTRDESIMSYPLLHLRLTTTPGEQYRPIAFFQVSNREDRILDEVAFVVRHIRAGTTIAIVTPDGTWEHTCT